MNKITIIVSLFIILTFTVIEAHAYLFDDYVLMEKNNNQLIYVYEVSVEKLEERGFAQKTADFAKECDTRFIEDNREDLSPKFTPDYPIISDCVISKHNDILCISIINSTDACIQEFVKPINLKDCKMIYKMFSVYYMQGLYESNLEMFPYFHDFSRYFCDLVPDYVNSGAYSGYDEWVRIFSDTQVFNFYDGNINTINIIFSGTNESSPPRHYGGLNFSSNDYDYELNIATWQKYFKSALVSENKIDQ